LIVVVASYCSGKGSNNVRARWDWKYWKIMGIAAQTNLSTSTSRQGYGEKNCTEARKTATIVQLI
jgi:hypothetical protein